MAIPSLRDLLTVAFRHKYKIAGTFFVIVAAGAALLFSLPDMYESEARVLITVERGGLTMDPAAQGGVGGAYSSMYNATTNERTLIESRELAELVVKKSGPGGFLTYPDGQTWEAVFANSENPEKDATNAAVGGLMGSIKAVGEGDTIIITIEHTDPEKAHTLLATLLEQYRERHIVVHSSAASPEFFSDKAKEISGEMEEQEESLRLLKEQYDIGSIKEEKALAFQRVTDLESRMSDLRSSLDGTRATIASLTRLVAETQASTGLAPMEMENPRVVELEGKLLDLDLQRIELESQFVNSGELRRLRSQIAAVKEKIAKLPPTLPRRALGESMASDPAIELERTQIRLATSLAEQESVAKDLKAATTRMEELESHEAMVMGHEQEIEHLRTLYFDYRKGLERAKINARLDRDKVSNISVVQPATLPDYPVGPRRMRNLLLLMMMGLGAGIGFALVSEYLDNTVKAAGDLERKLGLEVLATVPENEFKKCI